MITINKHHDDKSGCGSQISDRYTVDIGEVCGVPFGGALYPVYFGVRITQ
jgi:hypothetical protein